MCRPNTHPARDEAHPAPSEPTTRVRFSSALCPIRKLGFLIGSPPTVGFRRIFVGTFVEQRIMLIAATACQRQGVLLGMRRIRPKYLDPDPSNRSVTADVLVREEPEEDDEDNDEEDDEDEDEEEGDGYSE